MLEVDHIIMSYCCATSIKDVPDRLQKIMSNGYKHSIGLAQTLIGGSDLLVLDELASGQIIDMKELMKDSRQKHAIIIISHILLEIDSVSSRILVLNKGFIVADSPVDKLLDTVSEAPVLNILIFIIPMLFMRQFPEERKQKTLQLLFKLPLSLEFIVLGKFLVIMTITRIGSLVTLIYPVILILVFFGSFAFMVILGNYLGVFLLIFFFLPEKKRIADIVDSESILLKYNVSEISAVAVINENSRFGLIHKKGSVSLEPVPTGVERQGAF